MILRRAAGSCRRKSMGRLRVPHERVAGQLHVVALPEVHQGVGRAEVVPIGSGSRMNERPFHVVLGDDLVELRFDQRDVGADLLRAAAEAGAGGDAAVDGRAHHEMVLEDVLESGRLGGPRRGGLGRQG